ncbi:hypothetical protein LJ739_06915 [Aestuariibacter halophilus]|uniref:Uncharacterized protein n=1 Tax=Fluctibacter halophilus TaxID=226011 RepID=A0ABS8G636_9ALTE|nr:hypothetical protein [Aestuariibacter halophilus]MCC2615968.1 hypothetical protein [Aestuariibacter halophilus]
MGNQDQDKIAFWKSVEKTDPKYVKWGQVSGQNRAMVDAQYKKRLITKMFGMYGRGWGIETGSEEYERTHFENQTCILHYRAVAYYVADSERCTFPIASSIRESYVTKGGNGYLKVDDEAVKKVRTDALTKGFTDLGFCADIHMGLFDDQDYVAGVTAQSQIAAEEEREAELEKQNKDLNEWFKKELEAIELVERPVAKISVINRVMEKVKTRCDAMGFNSEKYVSVLTKKRAQISQQTNQGQESNHESIN